MVSRAVSTTAVSAGSESIATVSAEMLSTMIESMCVESLNLLTLKESEIFLNPMALPASIPNDCNAAKLTSRSGTHIFAKRFFINPVSQMC